MLGYIYCGRLDTGDMEVLKGVYLAANMLQMADLGKPHQNCHWKFLFFLFLPIKLVEKGLTVSYSIIHIRSKLK